MKKILDTLKDALERLSGATSDLTLQPVPVKVGNRFGRNF